ncbi:MAG: hypothetical protein PHI71_08510 [Acidiphilium sp.]|nr:hypothetical protein [Acidiphilium sp.]
MLSNLLLYLLAGASAGFLGGLLGIGGGLLIVAALSLTLSSSSIRLLKLSGFRLQPHWPVWP